MRPKSVERFELLFFVSLCLGVVILALTLEQLFDEVPGWFAFAMLVAEFPLWLGLMLLVSRKGSNIARWVLGVFFVLGSIIFIPIMAKTLEHNSVAAVLASVQIALQGAAIYFVFRPDAKPWFQKTSE